MKLRIFQLIVIFTMCSTFVGAQSDIRLEINSKLPSKYAKTPLGVTRTAASQLFPYVEITIKKVEYMIAFDKVSRKIKYIFTNDDDFRNADGLKVGEELTIKWNDLEILGYFQLRGTADKNGWQPVVGGSSAFEGDFLERVKKDGQLRTEIDGFAKGYNY